LHRRRLIRLVTGVTGAALLASGAGALRRGARADDAPDLPQFVLRRDVWAAVPPGAGMRPHAIERVTLHHTGPPVWYGDPPAAGYLRIIQSFHTGPERRWPDIAYHLLIDLDGIVWQGRPLAFAGDTATSYDPTGHALVAVLGDYDVQQPNHAQLIAIEATISWLLTAYALDPATAGAHRDYAATACPGRNLVTGSR
jgi:hypothetical protein